MFIPVGDKTMLETGMSLILEAAQFFIIGGISIGVLELRVRNPPRDFAGDADANKTFKPPYIGTTLVAIGLLLSFIGWPPE